MTLISAITFFKPLKPQNPSFQSKNTSQSLAENSVLLSNSLNCISSRNKASLAFKSNDKKRLPQLLPYKNATEVFFMNKTTQEMTIKGEPAIINSNGLDLPCWFIAPEKGKPTVLYCHGNTTNITNTQKVGEHYSNKGIGVLMVEYPGYGEAPGKASQTGLFQSALDGAGFLNKKGIRNKDIIVHGYSLGGAVAAHTVSNSEKPFKALILDSTFTSMPDVMANWINNKVLLSEVPEQVKANPAKIKDDIKHATMPTQDYLKEIPKQTKILVVHSKNDELVDEAVGEKLMNMVKIIKPDAVTKWENKTPLGPLAQNNYAPYHMDYECRMPAVFEFIDTQLT